MFSDLLIYGIVCMVWRGLFYILWKIVGGVVVGGIGWSGQGEGGRGRMGENRNETKLGIRWDKMLDGLLEFVIFVYFR